MAGVWVVAVAAVELVLPLPLLLYRRGTPLVLGVVSFHRIDKQSIWMESRHNLNRLMNEHATEPHNRSTTSPLVINRAETRLISPRRLIPTCESKNTSKNKIARLQDNCI
uniref:Uncharacterized protein n=1 Tax=Oryza barthii TaxID=65489 RepID=A0A679BCS9_9ORYZ|nr:hypothetical protein [Oryza barthii]